MGKVLSADELLTTTWGPQYKEDKEILWVSIARLRQKLGAQPASARTDHHKIRAWLCYAAFAKHMNLK